MQESDGVDDIVDRVEIAGVRLTWWRQRGAGDAGHHVVACPLDDETQERHGPMPRRDAELTFGAMQSALVAAARQQARRLASIMRGRDSGDDSL